MNDKAEARPIIVVKRRKAGGGHHGGAWKVAYADFVTAMMAFFMVMWLVNAVNKDQRAAMFEYFKNPSMEEGKSVKPAPGSMGPGGASTAVINMGGGLDAVKTAQKKETGIEGNSAKDVEAAKKLAEEAERKQLESLEEQLRAAIDASAALKPFKDQLLIDITPEGLRIQIVDAQNRPMFDLGSSKLKDYTTRILKELTGYLNSVPNRLSLSGHTDTTPYAGKNGYSNWDLSADRANAARRALETGGLNPDKIARIVGLSSAVLFDKDNPRNPINRRISIIVMTKKAEEAALRTDSRQASDDAEDPGANSAAGVEGAAGAEGAAGTGTSPGAPTAAAPAAAAASAPAAATTAAPAAAPVPAAPPAATK